MQDKTYQLVKENKSTQTLSCCSNEEGPKANPYRSQISTSFLKTDEGNHINGSADTDCVNSQDSNIPALNQKSIVVVQVSPVESSSPEGTLTPIVPPQSGETCQVLKHIRQTEFKPGR